MSRRLEKLLAQTPSDRWLLVRLMLLLPALGVALRLIGFKRTRDLLSRLAPSRNAQPSADCLAEGERAQRIARLVAIAAHHGPYRATCLRQSLALWWLLRRRGVPVELRIGVRKGGGNLQAHAWVDCAGSALNQSAEVTSRFATFQKALSAFGVGPAVPRAVQAPCRPRRYSKKQRVQERPTRNADIAFQNSGKIAGLCEVRC